MYVTQTVGDEVKLYNPALNHVTKHKFANMNLASSTSIFESLSILRYIDEKNSLQDSCKKFKVSRETIERIVESRRRFEEKIRILPKRRNLSNADKVKIAHFLDENNKITAACTKFGASERTARRIAKNKEVLRTRISAGAPLHVSRPLKPLFLK